MNLDRFQELLETLLAPIKYHAYISLVTNWGTDDEKYAKRKKSLIYAMGDSISPTSILRDLERDLDIQDWELSPWAGAIEKFSSVPLNSEVDSIREYLSNTYGPAEIMFFIKRDNLGPILKTYRNNYTLTDIGLRDREREQGIHHDEYINGVVVPGLKEEFPDAEYLGEGYFVMKLENTLEEDLTPNNRDFAQKLREALRPIWYWTGFDINAGDARDYSNKKKSLMDPGDEEESLHDLVLSKLNQNGFEGWKVERKVGGDTLFEKFTPGPIGVTRLKKFLQTLGDELGFYSFTEEQELHLITATDNIYIEVEGISYRNNVLRIDHTPFLEQEVLPALQKDFPTARCLWFGNRIFFTTALAKHLPLPLREANQPGAEIDKEREDIAQELKALIEKEGRYVAVAHLFRDSEKEYRGKRQKLLQAFADEDPSSLEARGEIMRAQGWKLDQIEKQGPEEKWTFYKFGPAEDILRRTLKNIEGAEIAFSTFDVYRVFVEEYTKTSVITAAENHFVSITPKYSLETAYNPIFQKLNRILKQKGYIGWRRKGSTISKTELIFTT